MESKKWYKWTYLQGRDRDTDMWRMWGMGGWGEFRVALEYIHYQVQNNSWRPAIHLSLVMTYGVGSRGREAQEGRGVCVCARVCVCMCILLLFSGSVISDSLGPHGLQHARCPCPSPSAVVCSNSCALSWWLHQTFSFSVIPFSHLQSFPESGSFPMSQLFASGGRSIGASALVLPMNIQGWFLLGLTGKHLLISWL